MNAFSPAATLPAASTEHPHDAGVVTGRPRAFLRVEGLALLATALVAYSRTGLAWWLVPATVLLPDLGALGYVLSRRAGALLYNLAHATPVPLVLLGLGLWQSNTLAIALALVWLIHIGMDRAMCYGFKHDDHPNHTHLGWHGRHS